MAVKIRLTRMGKIRTPHYRVVVADSRTRRDGRAIEQIGQYHPTEEPSFIEIDSERAQYWLSVGAQPTDQVKALLKLTGDWQKHTGEGEAVSTVKGRSAKEAFEAPAAKSVISAKPAKEEAPAEESAEAAEQTEA
ncbi:30S ribosomal protein S16 [Brevibacterium album]|uniref:30S ribosomal protein S16 n=1 Tax=Brevibacterium album TaxID=417948 RepID=UPI0004049F02|nr:30S ribosomal protein S16 [Brevibacterium album]